MGKTKFRFIWSLVLTASLAVTVRAADKQDPSIASEYERLSKQFEDARQEYVRASQKANEEELKSLKYPDVRKHAREMLALAEKNPKDPAAVDPLIVALRSARYEEAVAPRAIELLQAHHIESEKLGAICHVLGYGSAKDVTGFLAEVIAKNPRNEIKATASLSLGQLLAPKDPKQAEKHFNDVIEKYGTKEQKKSAKGELFEMHNLAIGKVAPEIKGEDVDGKKFKLSDYRGKVVVLDFWGDW